MCSDTLQSEVNALQRSSENATLGRQIGMKQKDARKDWKMQESPQRRDNSRPRKPRNTHSSMLNKSSTSAVAGLLRGLNKPVPFANPRELGIRLLVE